MRESYPDPIICQLCGKNLNCMANILSHSYLHEGIKPYKCPKCNYSTRTRFNLRVHFGSCANIEKFSYKRQKYTTNDSKRKRKRKTTRNNIHDINKKRKINNNNDDLLDKLPDSGPASIKDRDTSCLIQVHIQNFPRLNNTKLYDIS